MGDENGFSEWGGYMNAKITKLEEQFSSASSNFRQSDLFSGISIFVNGLTNPSAQELKQIMMIHGGTFHHYERSHTTYIIASNLPDVKVRNMNTNKIISPQWVLECIKEKRILDYTRYLLYTNQKPSQPRIQFTNKPKLQLDEKDTTNLSSFNGPESNDRDKHLLSVAVKQKENLKTVTAKDPNFISEFYNNSRLHHISTLSSTFKQYINDLRERQSQIGVFPKRTLLLKRLISKGVEQKKEGYNNTRNLIMHIDMDCFFVSVGLRSHPQLRGYPVAVTHSKGGLNEVPMQPGANRHIEMQLLTKRFEEYHHDNILSNKVRNGFNSKMSLSEIASCSYEARAKGIKNGMFVGEALKLCPELKTIQYDFEGYKEVACILYETVAQYTLNVEAVSCDEMFVDLSTILKELKVPPMDLVSAIRDEVHERTGCPCSAGVGANKLQARMATKRAKPNGQYYMNDTDVKTFMADIPVRDLPGVGSNTAHILNEAALITCGDLQKIALSKLQVFVGKKFGETLYNFCRGIDNRQLTYAQVRKSVSAEVNYGIRFTKYDEVEKFLYQLCSEVHARLTDIKCKTKNITLKLMVRAKDAPREASKFMGHGVCDHVTKSVSLSEFTNDLQLITRNVLCIIKSISLQPSELRGIGIQLSKLKHPNDIKEKGENTVKNMFQKFISEQKDKESYSIKSNIVATNRAMDSDFSCNKELNSGLKRPNTIIDIQQNVARKNLKFHSSFSLPSVVNKTDVRQSQYYSANNVQTNSNHKVQKELVLNDSNLNSVDHLQSGALKDATTTDIFSRKNCIKLLIAWIKNCDAPESYDIYFLCQHSREMVRQHDINCLYEFLTFFCRLLNSRLRSMTDCTWHMAYRFIINSVQTEMRTLYGNKLYLSEQLQCGQCCDNGERLQY